MLTRKHFKAIAETVSKISDPKTREDAARTQAAICAESNPNFDLDRFLAACNVPRAITPTFPAVRCFTK